MTAETPTIGFVGTGGITEALVRGLCAGDDTPYPIILSPRNQQRSAALAAEFSTRVRVARDNQDVLEQADWVFLALQPSVGKQIVQELRFRPEHRVVNLIANLSLTELSAIIGPTAVLVHMIPLPGCARRLGPIATYPQNQAVLDTFGLLGQIVPVDTAQKVHLLQTLTCVMAGFYTLIDEMIVWSGRYGLAEEDAQAFLGSLFTALSQQAMVAPEGPRGLAQDMTPGGLNLQVLAHLRECGALRPWTEALEPVFAFLDEG